MSAQGTEGAGRQTHVEKARAVIGAVSAGDLDQLDRQLADDIVWHVGGEHPLSGDYLGREAVRGYHGRVHELTGSTLRLEPVDVLAGDHHLGIFLRATAEGTGRPLDTTMVEAVRLTDDGQWAEFWGLAEDQELVDAFWKELAQ
jgi:ketosteroid isomerase-like protein